MEQERIPFNIKYRPEIEAGKLLVETREGKPVRIICWDRKSYSPIVALVQYYESETEHSFTEMGEYVDSETQTNLDLFLVPNPDYKEPTTICSASVDWDWFRKQASLQIAAGFAANGNFLERSIGQISEDIAEYAVVTADMLIKRLKEGKK